MIIDNEFLKKLRSSFDLNEYEVKIWTALLSKGIAAAGELSEISNVPRSRSYDVLESLEKRGFVIVKLGKPIKYIAVKPSDILSRVRREIISNADSQVKYVGNIGNEDFFNEISLLYKNGIDHVDPDTLSGLIQNRKNIYNQMESMMNRAKKSVIIATSEEGLKRKIDLFKPLLIKLHKKGIELKIVSSKKVDPDLSNFSKFKVLEKLSARFILVDDKEILFMLNKDNIQDKSDVAIWVDSPYFVNAMSSMFDVVWKQK